MSKIFLDNFYEYADRDLIPIPLSGKVPVIKDWTNLTIDTIEVEKYANCNIGILTGYKVVAVDIDIEESKKLVPLSPIVKKGKKGETRFFKYNGEANKKRHDLGIEILSKGNQTVMPPSIHPETKEPYVFTSFLGDWDDLPILPDSFKDLIYQNSKGIEITQSDGNRCNHGSHTKISSMLVAKIKEGESIDCIIDELLSYDTSINPDISYFLCPTRKWKTKNKTVNCMSMITEAMTRNDYKKVEFNIIDTHFKEDQIDYKKHKLPKLRGIAQEMFEYIYNNSPVPRSQFAFASAISTMSLLLGNKLQFNGTLPNLYSAILAPSGAGKDAPMRFPIDLLSSIGKLSYIGESNPASDAAVIMSLPTQRIRIDVIDEASGLFKSMNSKDSYASNIANMYQMIYSSAGGYFGGKSAQRHISKETPDGKLGACENPYVTLLCGLTITDFQTCFNSNLMDKGIGGRFLYFIDDEPKKLNFFKKSSIPESIQNYAKKMLQLDNFCLKIPEINIHSRTLEFLNECVRELDDKKLNTSDDCPIRPLINRSVQMMIKLAIIDSCSQQIEKPTEYLNLNKDSIEWAMKALDANFKNFETFIHYNLSDNANYRKLQLVTREILKRGSRGISLTELSNIYTIKNKGIYKKERREILETLLENEEIHKNGKKLVHKNFIKK